MPDFRISWLLPDGHGQVTVGEPLQSVFTGCPCLSVDMAVLDKSGDWQTRPNNMGIRTSCNARSRCVRHLQCCNLATNACLYRRQRVMPPRYDWVRGKLIEITVLMPRPAREGSGAEHPLRTLRWQMTAAGSFLRFCRNHPLLKDEQGEKGGCRR